MDEINVGLKIKDYLKKNGIKQTYLANQLNRNDAELSFLLTGKIKLTANEFIRITNILNTTPNEILDITSR